MLFLAVVFAVALVAGGVPLENNPQPIVPMLDGRIVGGESTFIEEYPYQASLLYRSSHRCGAVIISENYVLTAAHCTDGISATYLSLRVGSSFRNSGGAVVQVDSFYQDGRYNDTIIDYDITVLKLASTLSFGSAVQPISLPDPDYVFVPGKISQVTGWGALSQGGASASQLQVVEVPLLEIEYCIQAYGAENVTSRMLCAGFFDQGGKDACQGDSGGPLAVDGVLLGLVSWGWGCARPENPGVYSNIVTLRDYITEVTGL